MRRVRSAGGFSSGPHRGWTLWAVAAVLLALVAPAAWAGPEGAAGSTDEGRLTVFVSILPQSWFVERIGGRDVEVFFLVGPGDSPATFEPAPRKLVRLAEADLLLTIGVPFERMLLPRLEGQGERLEVVDMAAGIERRHMHAHGRKTSEAGPEDPHVWLDPVRAEILARNTRDALVELRPGQRERFDENLGGLIDELRRVDARLRDQLAPFDGGTILVFHPAFGYFTDRYGLEQMAIQSGGLEPAPRRLARTIDRAQQLGIRTVFAQPQSPSASVKAVAEAIDGKIEVLDPLAPKYIDNLLRIGEEVRKALRAARSTER